MDPISLFMIAILGMLIYFMIRNSRKQRKTQEELQEKLTPGADVMTSFGLFATLVDLDDEN
ncbi:MAG: preprotein translocase subunit YajC, partial [Pontimonas sp.]